MAKKQSTSDRNPDLAKLARSADRRKNSNAFTADGHFTLINHGMLNTACVKSVTATEGWRQSAGW